MDEYAHVCVVGLVQLAFCGVFFIYDGQSKGAISGQTLKNTHLCIGIQIVISDRDSDLPVLE